MPRRPEPSDRYGGPELQHRLSQGTRRAVALSVNSLERLAQLGATGDPQYARYWAELEHVARELAHNAGLVKHGLRLDAKLRSDAADGEVPPRPPVRPAPVVRQVRP